MNARTFLNRVLGRLLRPLAPRALRLPLEYQLLRIGGAGEPELFHLEKFCGAGRGVAVDVGANAGLFSYRLSKLFPKVCAFEANADLLENLRECNPGNIEITAAGLSSAAGSLTLHIPVLHGRLLTGWASLAPGNCPDTDEHVAKTVEVRTLDSFELGKVSFIKIDVEGHELEVLKGAARTLAASRPILLIEIRDANLPGVRAFLGSLGYRETTLRALCGIGGSDGNYLFVAAL